LSSAEALSSSEVDAAVAKAQLALSEKQIVKEDTQQDVVKTKKLTPEEKAERLRELKKQISGIVVKCLSKHKEELEPDEFKTMAKKVNMIPVM
jgi:actin-like ATPase involved in cell morphogenesis